MDFIFWFVPCSTGSLATHPLVVCRHTISKIFSVIYQPRQFTKVWLSLQTSTFILQWLSIFWFSQRLFGLNRTKTLIEKSILTLAYGMQLANFPIQLFALGIFCTQFSNIHNFSKMQKKNFLGNFLKNFRKTFFLNFVIIFFFNIFLATDAPWMLLASDIRTGLVNFLLFSFWLIFISEHLLHRANRNKIVSTY